MDGVAVASRRGLLGVPVGGGPGVGVVAPVLGEPLEARLGGGLGDGAQGEGLGLPVGACRGEGEIAGL